LFETRPRGWPVLLAYFFAAIAVVVAQVVAIGPRYLARREMPPAGRLLLAPLASAAVLAALAVAAADLWRRRRATPGLHAGPSAASPWGCLAAAVGTLALSVCCATASDLLGLRSEAMDEIGNALQHAPGGAVAGVVAVAVAPGLGEETFFRGFMQTRLVASWGRWPGIVATAAAFGLLHFDPVQGPQAFVLGLFLGWVVVRLDGIRPSMAAHVANNAAFVLLAGPTGSGSRRVEAMVVALAAVVFAACTFVLRTRIALR